MELEHALSLICRVPFDRLIISKPRGKTEDEGRIIKMAIRPVLLKERPCYQVERFTKQQAFQKNIETGELKSVLLQALENDFLQLNGFVKNESFQLRISAKGKVLFQEKEIKPYLDSDKERPLGGPMLQTFQKHDKVKQYILREGDYVSPVLVDLGVLTKEGLPVRSMGDKFRQINQFIQLVSEKLDPSAKSLSIVDLGCGKGYLTFALYDYLTNVRHLDVTMTGVDLKEKVMADCRALAAKYGFQKLSFVHGSIEAFEPQGKVDMVLALHACDTATDYALYKAICWQAPYVFSVPCCQHEINQQLTKHRAASLSEYGLLKERFSALLTDSLRADLLVTAGYSVDVLEFVDEAHSPKNVMIRAARTPRLERSLAQKEARGRVEAILERYRITPTLYRLLQEGEQQANA